MDSLLKALLFVLAAPALTAANVDFPSASSVEGYLARLLLNEVAFPGEQGYVSEANTRRAMENILLVLDARIHYIPMPYTRFQVAQTSSEKLLDVITAGGVHGQVEGFYRDAEGYAVAYPRVAERLHYLLNIANDGTPGRFARLLNHAAVLASNYIEQLQRPENLYAHLRIVTGKPVTGRAY